MDSEVLTFGGDAGYLIMGYWNALLLLVECGILQLLTWYIGYFVFWRPSKNALKQGRVRAAKLKRTMASMCWVGGWGLAGLRIVMVVLPLYVLLHASMIVLIILCLMFIFQLGPDMVVQFSEADQAPELKRVIATTARKLNSIKPTHHGNRKSDIVVAEVFAELRKYGFSEDEEDV